MYNNTSNKIHWFDFFYMLVMVIYMGQATKETQCMVMADIVKQLIPTLIPIVLTLIQVVRHRVSFSNVRYKQVMIVCLFWIFAVILKFDIRWGNNLMFASFFFLLYSITIAYIHAQIYGRDYFDIYERIMVFIAKISLVLWLFAVLVPSVATPFFRSLPLADTSTYGNHLLYLFTWMDPDKGQIYGGLIRNAGCSWEPGRYAIMLLLALAINILRNGISFKGNTNFIYLLLALATTQSTTGYATFAVMCAVYYFNPQKKSSMIMLFVVSAMSFYLISNLDFLGEKINEQSNIENALYDVDKEIEVAESRLEEGEYWMSLDRFPAMYFEFQNVINDPILGYTQIKKYSYFYNEISTHFSLTGGLVKLLGAFGIPLGLLLYLLLFKSCGFIVAGYTEGKNYQYMLFLCIMFSSVSYVVFGVPIFTTMFFYCIFSNRMQD